MKKFFDLQLFADEAAEVEPVAEGSPASDAKPKDDRDTPKYSDNDLDKLFNRKFAEHEKKKAKEIEEAKAAEREAAKLEKMNEHQRTAHELEQAKKELDELKREKTLSEMSKTARKLLSDKNISVPDELLSMMVTTDAEETKAAIDSFATMFNEAVEKAKKEFYRGEPPKRGAGESPVSEIEKRIKKYT